jgi:chitodextrinase
MQFTEVHRSEFSKVFAADAGTAESLRTHFFHSCVFLPVLITAGLLVLGTVRADAATNAAAVIQSQLSPMLDSLTQASVSIARQDRDSASTQVRLTISLADGLSSTIQSPEIDAALGKKAKALQTSLSRFQARLAIARMLVDEPAVTDGAALASLLNVIDDGQRLRKLMASIPASSTVIMVREVASRGVALHYSGEVVCFHVDILNDSGKPSCGPADVSVANLGGDPAAVVMVESPSLSSPTDFCLTLGPDAGTIRITVTQCSESNSILLYSYGVPKTSSHPMDPPRNLATAPQRFDAIRLAWSYKGKGAKGFKVERSTTGASWAEVGTTGSAATSYTDTGLNESATYYYRVRAYRAKGYSGYSNTAQGNTGNNTDSAPPPTPADVIAPSVPNGVTAVTISATQVTVHWNASTDAGGSGLAGYRVYRAGTLITTTAATSYTDTGLSPGTQYCYTIRAYDGAGNASTASASACVTTQTPASTTPAPPSNLAAMVVTPTYITLNWQDNSNNETGFQIERAPADSGPWSVVGTTGVDATSYVDNGLAPSTAYWYRVAAFN